MSDDEQGVYSHLRNEWYLGSMKPFSEGEPGSLGNTCKNTNKNTKKTRILGMSLGIKSHHFFRPQRVSLGRSGVSIGSVRIRPVN